MTGATMDINGGANCANRDCMATSQRSEAVLNDTISFGWRLRNDAGK